MFQANVKHQGQTYTKRLNELKSSKQESILSSSDVTTLTALLSAVCRRPWPADGKIRYYA